MKCKTHQIMLILLFSLVLTIPFCSAVYLPTGWSGGFQNHSYIKFAEAMNFTTAYQEDSLNATYPDFWFFGNTTAYGFHSVNANVTVNTFFSSNLLNMTLTQTSAATATVKIYTATLGEPNSIVGATTKSYASTTNIATITVTNPSNSIVTLYWSNYTVALTKQETIILQGDTVHFDVAVAYGTGQALTNYELNVTRDGGIFIQNLTATNFTDAEANQQAHIYSANGLYDGIAGETVNFTITDLTVTWQPPSGGGGGGVQPSPSPSPTPTPIAPGPILPSLPTGTNVTVVTIGIVVIIAFVLAATFASRRGSYKKPKVNNKYNPPKIRKPKSYM